MVAAHELERDASEIGASQVTDHGHLPLQLPLVALARHADGAVRVVAVARGRSGPALQFRADCFDSGGFARVARALVGEVRAVEHPVAKLKEKKASNYFILNLV